MTFWSPSKKALESGFEPRPTSRNQALSHHLPSLWPHPHHPAEPPTALVSNKLSKFFPLGSWRRQRLMIVSWNFVSRPRDLSNGGVSDLCPLPVNLHGVQKEWAQDPQQQPVSLRVGKLLQKLAPLLHGSIFYLKLNDPQYLRGNGRGWSPISSGTQPLGTFTEITSCGHLGQGRVQGGL